MLLTDLRDFLVDRPDDGIPTKDIIDHLSILDERPWPAYGKARKPINPKQIADILKPYEVRSSTIRVGAGTAKGYRKNDLRRAIGRYLGSPSVTTSQPAENRGKLSNSAVTNGLDVTDENRLKPTETGRCDVVTAGNGKSGGSVPDAQSEWPDDDGFEEFTI